MRGKPKSKSPDIPLRDSKVSNKSPEFIIRDGKVSAVVLDIDEYQEILERLEDSEDLRTLQEMRKKPLRFRKLEDFLGESGQLV